MKKLNQDLGKRGEAFAARWLKSQGYKIIGNNLHAAGGEVDILAYDEKLSLYVAFEVKTRSNHQFGLGIESVTLAKIKKIESALVSYFLKQDRFKFHLPLYEIHVLDLVPSANSTLSRPRFEVIHYADLS